MAEFDLRMKYTNPQTRACMQSMALLFPIWGIALPALLALFIFVLLRLPSDLPLNSSLVIIFGLLFAIAISACAAVFFDDDEIRVSKSGLRFPLKFGFPLKMRLQRTWDELVGLRLKWNRNDNFRSDESLTFLFQDGSHARLRLPELKRDELEQFFIAFEACAYKCERDADIPDFERAVQTKRAGSMYSYTELWDKSLSDKFSGATFTPLEPDAMLREGQLQILRQLAFGGFSAVYLARPAQGGFVIVKESSFPQTEEVQSKARELFKREFELLSKLDHPSVAKVLDYFIENTRHYLVAEHVEGIDLNRLVTQNGVQQSDVVRNWMKQVAGALRFIHEQSPPVVHRDVTPDNLMLKPDGTVVLIDFGAAKEIVSNFTGTIIGKQSFIAPEQFKGKPTPRSDIYSLGATAYFLLTGKLPEPLSQSNPRSVNDSLSDALCDLIERCTNLEENARPSSAELLDLLTDEVQSESITLDEAPAKA